MSKKYYQTIKVTAKTRVRITARKYSIGIKKWLQERIGGWFSSRVKKKHPEGVEKEQSFDRENPNDPRSYQEKVTDVKTGIVFHNVSEPLIQHRHRNYKHRNYEK